MIMSLFQSTCLSDLYVRNIKRGNRNNTGNRWRNKTFLVAKKDIFMSNLSTNFDRIKHFASGEIEHFSVGSHH